VKAKTPIEISFAFERVMNLAGGEQEYGDSTKAAIWSEIWDNQEIQSLALRYLVGSSHRATINLERLDTKLADTFGLGVKA
jgi:hypothetical protein